MLRYTSRILCSGYEGRKRKKKKSNGLERKVPTGRGTNSMGKRGGGAPNGEIFHTQKGGMKSTF